jgi:hypothetical protein
MLRNIYVGVCTKRTSPPMIRVIDEDVIIRFAVYHFPTSSSNPSFVAHEDREEIVSSDLVTSVVLRWILKLISLVGIQQHAFCSTSNKTVLKLPIIL